MERVVRLLKAYALYDTEVGYVQGLHLVVVPLLLHVGSSTYPAQDAEAFSLLVRLMKHYDLRSFYLPAMPGLHRRLYQFDRLIEQSLPAVHVHLARQGVHSHMYASQWFLTLFAYKFPASLVTRILDMILIDGLDALLQFAVALITRNAQQILSKTKLEDLLYFLKDGLFAAYEVEGDVRRLTGVSLLAGLAKGDSPGQAYRAQDLLEDAACVSLDQTQLARYAKEYEEAAISQRQREEAEESLRQSNITLQATVKRLEESLEVLNTEHIALANDLVTSKMSLAKLEDENEALEATVADLKVIVDRQPVEVEDRLRVEMHALMVKEQATSLRNGSLEEQLADMEQELIHIKMAFATEHQNHELLKQKMEGLKKSFNA
ncbi:rab-GTPase-TBC domain-domain-containing protein [Protomyces lactucae-debilis]|uniref:Rab-GTPase-TBC domain-domain-containing protein n=1 Tax=Protomyces lactucae-debilis TaxID=2754530 RepID=A0A1Y2FS77_PROLT|nr:rab-GTPase-TBC domain-containing protein [Protomyces lactucae-debilis]ORY86862.1 rab-GTPase-TBC domain-domain-containing protein [Protomyces lactucae-debilis]